MNTVYLDQNKWIDLARAHYGKTLDAQLKDALAFVKESTTSGTHLYPLSAIHYMETAKIKDPLKRGRLAEVMWELSGAKTMASYRLVLLHELELALAKRFRHVVPRPFTLISSGAAHAFGTAFRAYELPDRYRSRVPKELADYLTHALRGATEKSLLTGLGPGGITMPPSTTSTHARRFMEHLSTLHPKLSARSPDSWDDALHAITMVDMIDPLNEVLEHQNLSKSDIEGWAWTE